MEGFCSKEDSRKKDIVACLFEKQFQSATSVRTQNIFRRREFHKKRLGFPLDESCDR